MTPSADIQLAGLFWRRELLVQIGTFDFGGIGDLKEAVAHRRLV